MFLKWCGIGALMVVAIIAMALVASAAEALSAMLILLGMLLMPVIALGTLTYCFSSMHPSPLSWRCAGFSAGYAALCVLFYMARVLL